MQTTISPNCYSDPTLEGELKDERQQINQEVQIHGANYGSQNRPALTGESILPYVSEYLVMYAQMITKVKQRVQPQNASMDARMVTVAAEEKVKKLAETKVKVETQLSNFKLNVQKSGINLNEIPLLPSSKKNNKLLILIGIAETLLNIGVFQLIGENFLLSVIFSAGISAALMLLVRQLAQLLKETTRISKLKAILFGLGVLLLLVTFYFLAQMRSEAMAEQGHVSVPPIAFVLLNIICIIPPFVQIYNSTVPKAEKQQIEKLLKLKDQRDEMQQQVDSLGREIEQIKQDTAKEVNRILHRPEYAKALTEQIFGWQVEVVEKFKAANISNRPDRKIPENFSLPIEQLFQTVN